MARRDRRNGSYFIIASKVWQKRCHTRDGKPGLRVPSWSTQFADAVPPMEEKSNKEINSLQCRDASFCSCRLSWFLVCWCRVTRRKTMINRRVGVANCFRLMILASGCAFAASTNTSASTAMPLASGEVVTGNGLPPRCNAPNAPVRVYADHSGCYCFLYLMQWALACLQSKKETGRSLDSRTAPLAPNLYLWGLSALTIRRRVFPPPRSCPRYARRRCTR